MADKPDTTPAPRPNLEAIRAWVNPSPREQFEALLAYIDRLEEAILDASGWIEARPEIRSFAKEIRRGRQA